MIYRIVTTDNVELGYTDNVNYICINKRNGSFNFCGKAKAIGISYKGVSYNLYGHNEIPNARTVIIKEDDYGDRIMDLAERDSELRKENERLSAQLAETDEAAIELYEASLIQEETNAEQDEAIIQIYEMIGEVTNG